MGLITRKGIFTAAASIVLLLGSTLGNADPIRGALNMVGFSANPVDDMGDPSGLADAHGVDFTGDGWVGNGTLDFAGMAGTPVTYNDFTFNPSSGVDPLWTFDFGGKTYSFAAISFNVTAQNNAVLGIAGSGNLTADGFDITPGSWTFTMNGGGGIFSWSSTTVPEPATLALFGAGLLGLGLAGRRRKMHAAK